MSIVTQRIYTGDSIVYAGENGGGGGVSNSHTIANPGGSNTVVGPFTATSNSGNHGTAHHSLFDANGNSIGYPVPKMPGGPQYVLSADDYGGMAWALFASKIQAALSSSDGSVTFTPTDSGSDVTVNVEVVHTSIDATVPIVEVKTVTKINADISRRLGTIDSSVTTLICVLNPLPDELYEHEYRFKFSTAGTLGIDTFKVVGPSVAPVAITNDLSSKVIKFTATQLNAIYALVADQILVDATLNVAYTAATHTLSVGAETLVLDGLSDSDVYFVCDTNFGLVTALGPIVPSVFGSVIWMQSAPSLLPSKTYEFSVVDNCAIFVGSV